jgi:sphingolipid delta-4 desaturase
MKRDYALVEDTVTEPRDNFHWVKYDEPHKLRRQKILAAHPEIEKLQGVEPRTKYVVTAFVFFQVFMCWFVSRYVTSNWVLFALVYIFGATANHGLGTAIHEISHNLLFYTPEYNIYFNFFANLPICLPAAAAFRRYHLEHHAFQGVPGYDTDVPTHFEGNNATTVIKKIFWVLSFPFLYAFRPLIVKPKVPGRYEFVNLTTQLSFDLLIYYAFGWKAIIYLVGSTFFGYGLHPVGAQFIQEHYIFKEGQETYSYYGPLNILSFNVGYHVEHHDFPLIPCTRLPMVRKIAPEFYNNRHYHTSWVKVLLDFLFKPAFSPYSRIVRDIKDHRTRRANLASFVGEDVTGR